MSGKIATGGGESNFLDEKPICGDIRNLANVIASDIVNEILENALDIATCANDTGVPWQDIKGASSETSFFITEDKTETEEDEPNVCADIVGDMVQKMGLSTTPTMNEILDNLNKIKSESHNPNESNIPLQEEMKMLLSEVLSSPYEVNFNAIPANGAIGDQPYEQQPAWSEAESETHKSVQKKTRLTDLVKNSPQLIAEYFVTDEKAKRDQDEWEESEERLVQVIELDHVHPSERYSMYRNLRPENVPLPNDDVGLLEIPKDEKQTMRVIEMPTNTCNLGSTHHPYRCEGSNGAKGDDSKNESTHIMIPHSADSGIGEAGIAPVDINEKTDSTEANISKKKSKKKKWNLGNKLFGFLKKGRKKQDENITVQKT